MDFYDVDIAYDLASNITSTVDHVHADLADKRRFDAKYTLDGMYRLTAADEGQIITGSIASGDRARRESWQLSQTGNFADHERDMDWDSTFDIPPDADDVRTHNAANEIATWRPDGTNTLNIAHDAVGNMTDDGASYKFYYDVFGRLIRVEDDTPKTIAEYRYNGLGYRTGWHGDATDDGEADGDDPWYRFCYDEKWRIVGTYRDDDDNPGELDADPKEQFHYHAAGLGGYGASSYIDSVILRDRDDTGGWLGDADGTLEERRYYCQNWRADVSVVLTDTAAQVESVKYLSYGTPIGIPAGDVNGDGEIEDGDIGQIEEWWGLSAYRVRADLDLDGDVDEDDRTIAATSHGTVLGYGVLTGLTTTNRKGYAGYENDGWMPRFWHVRHRVLDSTLGRWTRRDPLGYVDGMSLFMLCSISPLARRDTDGLNWQPIDCPGRAPQNPASPEQLAKCCSEAQDFFGGGPWARTSCCNGAPMLCVNIGLAETRFGRWPRARDAWLTCVRSCEPLHCPNVKCEDVHGWTPGDPGGVGHQCSECNVNTCALNCLINACVDPSNCALCGDDRACKEAMQQRIEDQRRNTQFHCSACVEEILPRIWRWIPEIIFRGVFLDSYV